jgi:hypothetical protein
MANELVPVRSTIPVPYDVPGQLPPAGGYGPPASNPANPSGNLTQSSYGPTIGDVTASYAMISTGARYIGTIIPDVSVEEIHTDTIRITDHPVETGAAITDHAFHLPYEVQMRIGFSDSTHQTEGFVKMIYQTMVALQQGRQPLNVSTGKRLYQNMLIQSMAVTTDVTSEYALNMTVNLREIIITNTQQTQVSASNQATPSQTASQSDQGSQTPTAPDDWEAPHALQPSPPPPSSEWQPGDAGPPPPSYEPGGGVAPPGQQLPPSVGPGEAAGGIVPWSGVAEQPAQPPSTGTGIPQGTTGSAEMPYDLGSPL